MSFVGKLPRIRVSTGHPARKDVRREKVMQREMFESKFYHVKVR